LLATISPLAEEGDSVDFFDPNSWKNYIGGTGPSPFQSLVAGSGRAKGISQWLSAEDFDNVVEFRIGPVEGKLVIKASQEGVEDNRRAFRFRRGFFLLEFVWGSSVSVPYPVPFDLLGDRALGWLETTGYDEESGFRAALGNKGTRFVFKKKGGETPERVRMASVAEVTRHETDGEEEANNRGLTKRPVLICPQQFGGKPGDYTQITQRLRERGHPVVLARISALDWLSIVKSLPTKAYFEGRLQPSVALPFYMKAIDRAVARLPPGDFSVLSHSIGGWVARAWLGEVAAEDVRDRCKNFVSLGTPHAAPPPESIVAKVDQTRGLLQYVNDRWPGAYFPGVKYTCVASTAVKGQLKPDLDSLLAFASYFALIGEGGVEGDGITPVPAALLEGAESIILQDVYHADVLPNPIGSTNTKLIGCIWYADKIDEWIQAL